MDRPELSQNVLSRDLDDQAWSLRPDCVTKSSVTETILTLETNKWKPCLRAKRKGNVTLDISKLT